MHAALLAEHGGLDGPVDENALGSSLARPQQLHHYGDPPPSIFELAAALGFALAKNHCFRDGNKRMALASIDVFLQMNGYELVAEEADAVLTIQDLAASVIDERESAAWIEAKSKPL